MVTTVRSLRMFALLGWLGAGCDVAPDVVAHAIDAGLTSDDDAGEIVDFCELGNPVEPDGCEFEVPVTVGFNPGRFNVNVQQGGALVPFGGGLFSVDDCGHVIHGWYWSDPDEFTRIAFCPQTCALIDQWQKLVFEFGCNTRPPWFRPPPQP